MLKKLRDIGELIIYSNIFISFCLFNQALFTQRVLKAHIPIQIPIVVFLTSFCGYGYSIVNFKWKSIRSDGSSRQNFIAKYYNLLKIAIILSGLGILFLFLLIPFKITLIFVLQAILFYFYGHPFLKWGQKNLSFRNIPGAKNILIGLLWAVSGFLIPYMSSQNLYFIPLWIRILLFLKYCLLIFIISVLFDFRDRIQDQKKEIQTLSGILGEKGTKILGCFIVFIIFTLNTFSAKFLPKAEFWTYQISLIYLLALILLTNVNRKEYFYMVLIDGVAFIQFPIYLFLSSVL